MSTYATNNLALKLSNRLGIPYPVDQTGAFAFNQGDLVWFDISANGGLGLLKALDTDAHAAYLAGVALISSNLVLYANAQSQAIENNYESMAPVGVGDLFNFTGTAGETYSHGTAVYYNTDAQHIQKTTGSHSVGVVWLPLGNTLTGAVPVPVMVIAQFPVQFA